MEDTKRCVQVSHRCLHLVPMGSALLKEQFLSSVVRRFNLGQSFREN